ncbi:MAG: hypothetical protein JF606_03990 [Burkholderiales bacterium]|nr:hypothetical protein [Burkholderiales bacterium]
MSARLLWWVAAPVLAVVLFAGWRWNVAQAATLPAPQASVPQAAAPDTDAAKKQTVREYALEVIGLGVTLDKYRQGALWEVLSKGNAHVSIREQDLKKWFVRTICGPRRCSPHRRTSDP